MAKWGTAIGLNVLRVLLTSPIWTFTSLTHTHSQHLHHHQQVLLYKLSNFLMALATSPPSCNQTSNLTCASATNIMGEGYLINVFPNQSCSSTKLQCWTVCPGPSNPMSTVHNCPGRMYVRVARILLMKNISIQPAAWLSCDCPIYLYSKALRSRRRWSYCKWDCR